MGLSRVAFKGMGVIVATLVSINLILYTLLPPAQPLPAIPYAEQARQAAETAGTSAGFYDFDGDNGVAWHAPELDRLDGATFQYMAQNVAAFSLDVACAAPYTLEIAVLDSHIRPDAPDITLWLNRAQYPLTRERGVRRWVYHVTVNDQPAGLWQVVIGTARLFRPSSIIAEDDDRLIGAGVDWALVTSAACD